MTAPTSLVLLKPSEFQGAAQTAVAGRVVICTLQDVKAKEKTLAKLIKPVGFFNMKAQIRLIIVKRRRWRLFRLVT